MSPEVIDAAVRTFHLDLQVARIAIKLADLFRNQKAAVKRLSAVRTQPIDRFEVPPCQSEFALESSFHPGLSDSSLPPN